MQIYSSFRDVIERSSGVASDMRCSEHLSSCGGVSSGGFANLEKLAHPSLELREMGRLLRWNRRFFLAGLLPRLSCSSKDERERLASPVAAPLGRNHQARRSLNPDLKVPAVD